MQADEFKAAWQRALNALASNRPDEVEPPVQELIASGRLGPAVAAACASLQAALAWAQGREDEVIPALLRARELVPARPPLPTAFDESTLLAYLLACGEQPVFEALGQCLWQRRPEADLAISLARLCLDAGALRLAGGWCDRALDRNPRTPELLLMLAQAYYEAGRYKHAAVCALRGKHRDLARQALEQHLSQDPGDAEARLKLGKLLLEQQAWAAGLATLEPLLPDAQALRLLEQASELLLRKEKAHEAVPFLDALLRYPEHLTLPLDRLHADRAICAHHLADPDTRTAHFGRAHALASHPLQYELADLASLLPHIYTSKAQVDETRQELEQRLTRFIAEVEAAADDNQAFDLHIQPLFLLAYQGQNDRGLQELLGGFWWRLLGRMGGRRDSTHLPGGPGPIRVGFVSRYFYHHSVSIAYAPRIAVMASQPDFEVSCFHLGAPQDEVTRQIAASVQHFVPLHGSADPAGEILARKLDILIYTELGMDVQTYALALNRLAPIQMVFAGHPVTSGLPSIDYFISNRKSELPGAQAHYSETLATMDWVPTSIRPQLLEAPKRRLELGLPESEHLYFCPMTLFKVHPDFDEILAGILRADPKGRILFARYKDLPYHAQLQARWQRLIPDVADRISFLPWMPKQTLFQVMRQVDVVLDTIHFGGGTTIRMILAMNTPLVTMPGEFLRSRIVLPPLLRLGLEDLITTSPAGYVAKAVEIASNREYRDELQHRIGGGIETLFEDKAANFTELLDMFRRSVASYPDKLSFE